MAIKKKRTSSYPPYAQAKTQAIDLQMESASKYRAYIKTNKISYLPAYPERVYKDWISWNDYLGTNNKFMGEIKKVVRPWFEAVKWSQEFCMLHKIETGDQWLAYVKEHKDEIPADIPNHPDSKYLEWDSWKTWLGSNVKARLEVAKMSTALLCICSRHSLSVPGNLFTIIQAERGEVELRSALNHDIELRIVRCYKMENELKEHVMEIVKKHARHDGGGWFCENVNNILFELDLLLLPFPIKVDLPKVELLDEELLFNYTHRVG